jgi:hypothetical protein
MAKGFTVYIGMAVLSGRTDHVVELAGANRSYRPNKRRRLTPGL